jgi:POT family proton-dependent oligopeptide transporter
MRLFRDHPPGLFVCAATEMWERFSYYGMRALLVFFLTQHFLFTDDQSFLIYGAYTALVYLAPIVGGAISDRWLGARKAIVLGGVLLVLGHFGMAIEGPPAVKALSGGQETVVRDQRFVDVFYLSLSLIIVGVGFLKTNASALVGALYPPGDRRRDSGFTVFYMCYNLGGAVAPFVCGWLGQRYGWRYGFGLAGIGMIGGLIVFLRGQHHLAGAAEPPDPARLRERILPGLTRELAIYLGTVALVGLTWLLMHRQAVVGQLLSVFGLGTGAWIVYYALARCTKEERNRLLVCAVLTAFTIGFWAFYEQMGSSLALYSDRVVDRVVFGIEIPASTLQSLPSVFVILLAPWFSGLWLRLGARGREPSTAVKFSVAIATIAVAFGVLAIGTLITPPGVKVPLIWFGLNFFLLVVGELCLAPVGLAMITHLAPQRIVGVMMGTFFLAYSASSFIAGLIARLTSAPSSGAAGADLVAIRSVYASVFGRLGVMAAAVALVLLALAPFLTRLIRQPAPDTPAPEPSRAPA